MAFHQSHVVAKGVFNGRETFKRVAHIVKISIQLSSLNARLYDFFPFYLHLKMVCDMALQYFFFYNNLKENVIKISIKTLTCAH